jgi:hypothetical protein
MNYEPELLLVAAVAIVGVLHTMVPDHWVPITLIARHPSGPWEHIPRNREIQPGSIRAGLAARYDFAKHF